MKKLLIILISFLITSLVGIAQVETHLVPLEVLEGEKKIIADGYGLSPDEALQNALQNAVEQAAGAYVSSVTEIINDEVVRDELLSLSHGFIKEYRKLAESKFDNDYKVAVAAVIVEKQMIKSLEASGVKVTYRAGGMVNDLMAWDKMKENEFNMAKALFDVHQMKNYGIIWDYNLYMGDARRSGTEYAINGILSVRTNANYSIEFYNLKRILSELALESEEMKYKIPVAHAIAIGSKSTRPYDRYSFKVFKRKNNGKLKEATKLIDLVVPIIEPQIQNKRSAYGNRRSVPFKFYGINAGTGYLMQIAAKKYERQLSIQDKNRINESWLNRYEIIFDFFSKDFTPYVLVLTEGENLLTQSQIVTFYKFANPKTLDIIREYITFIFEAAHCKVLFEKQDAETIEFIPDAFFMQYAKMGAEVWSTNARVTYQGYVFNKLPSLEFEFKINKSFSQEEFRQVMGIEVVPFKGEQWMKK